MIALNNISVPFVIAHINTAGVSQPGYRFLLKGNQLSVALAPRTSVTDTSECLYPARATINGSRGRFNRAGDVLLYKHVTFDGMSYVNWSTTQWANITAPILDACS